MDSSEKKDRIEILITGSDGQLGTELRMLLDRHGIKYRAMNSRQLDITDKDKVDSYFAINRPKIVFDCAAYTAVELAEVEPGKTTNRRVNFFGTKNLAEASEHANATLVYISTDYVFDGRNLEQYKEDDIPNPLNQYGLEKLHGENIIREKMSKYYIIRTSWVFGKYGKNFVYTMSNIARLQKSVSVVDDQVGRPTWTRTLSEFMLHVVREKSAYGIYNFSNKKTCTWYEFATEILKNKNIEVVPIESESLSQKALRPQHSVMCLSKSDDTGFSNITWQEALGRFMQEVDL